MSQFDLSFSTIPWLDRHMVTLLLDFLSTRAIYSPATLLKAKYEVYSNTNMVDTALAQLKEYAKLDAAAAATLDSATAQLTEKRSKVIAEMTARKEACGPLVDAVTNANLSATRGGSFDFNFETLAAKHKITRTHVEVRHSLSHSLSFYATLTSSAIFRLS